MARRSIARYGPNGGLYHEHVNVGGAGAGPSAGLVFAVLVLFVGTAIYATLMQPVWDRKDGAAAQKAYNQLRISGSVHRSRLAKPDADGQVQYRVTVDAIVVNSDSKDHKVNVCVDDCLVWLPEDRGHPFHVQDVVRAHKRLAYHWSTVTIDSSFRPEGKPYINSVDKLSRSEGLGS